MQLYMLEPSVLFREAFGHACFHLRGCSHRCISMVVRVQA